MPDCSHPTWRHLLQEISKFFYSSTSSNNDTLHHMQLFLVNFTSILLAANKFFWLLLHVNSSFWKYIDVPFSAYVSRSCQITYMYVKALPLQEIDGKYINQTCLRQTYGLRKWKQHLSCLAIHSLPSRSTMQCNYQTPTSPILAIVNALFITLGLASLTK